MESVFLSSILELQTNVLIPDGFKYGRTAFAKDKPLEVSPDRLIFQYRRVSFPPEELPSDQKTIFFSAIRGRPNEDQIFLVRPLARGSAILKLTGLSSGIPAIMFNRSYDFWSNLRYTKINRPIKHLESLIEASLLYRGIVPLHSACVIHGDYAHLFIAPPDTGKSHTVMQLMRAGFDYAAEDLVLVRDNLVFPVPFTATVAKRSALPWQKRLIKLVWGVYGEKYTVYEELKIPFKPLAPYFKLGNLYLLTQSSTSSGIIIYNRQSIVRQVLMLNRMELYYHRDEVMLALLTLNENLPTLDDLMAEERARLEQMVHGASEVFLIEAHHPSKFSSLIRETLR